MTTANTARFIAIATVGILAGIAAVLNPDTVVVRRTVVRDYDDYAYEDTRLTALKRRLSILRSRCAGRNMWIRDAEIAVNRFEITRSLRDLKSALREVESAEFFIN